MANRITDEVKITIRKRALAGEAHRALAKEFGVGAGTVSRIRNEPDDYIIEQGKTIERLPKGVLATSVGIVSNDWQVPFHDETALELFLNFCQKEQPDWIDLAGDIHDFYQISRFDKNPNRRYSLQDDIDVLDELLCRLRAQNPNATIYYELGNHEHRLRKFLWSSKGEKLASLRCLKVENLLNLSKYNITPIEKWRQQGDLYIMHGTVLSKHAGYSAKLHFEKYGVTMIHGHSHRDGKFTRRTLEGHKAVWENYCLCKLDNVEYDPFPNWTQGWSKITMVGDRPYVEQIPIIAGEYIYGGKRCSI